MIFLTAMDFTLPLADPVLKFLIILLIILGAPLLLNKIRIPPLLGLIIAGAVIGPHGFNLVLRDSSIILSGTAGLLYIMFLAGLEITCLCFYCKGRFLFYIHTSYVAHRRLLSLYPIIRMVNVQKAFQSFFSAENIVS